MNMKRKTRRTIIIILALAILGTSSIYEIKKINNKKSVDANKVMAKETKSENKTNNDSERFKYIDKQIQDVIERDTKGKDMGVFFEDLSTGKVSMKNDNKNYISASTIKVALVMKVADLMHTGKVDENASIMYTPKCDESGTGVLQYEREKLKEPIKCKELMKLAIEHSDNIATNMLWIKYNGVDDYIKNTVNVTRKQGNNYLTARTQALLLERLYKNPDKNPIYNEIIKWMKNTEFHDRLDKYIPYEKVAHKVGDNEEYIHDTGIVYTKSPYILVVYSKGEDPEQIAKLSKDIYNIEKKR
ncbi:beta-lactamase class A-like protein [Clostridium baratii]|uniref:Beta-lactamase class A-like protein n=2 Tax=Clostridium baratii TaxID=1561 RepID=A0A174TVM7_9CLOT|nr:beta-lactamase class A-like protein [Clostridium baratii]